MTQEILGPFSDPLNIVFALLAIALLITFIRLVRGPSLPDRVVALDLMVLIVVGLTGTHSVATGQTAFLDSAIVLALVAFVATVAFARYLERRGQDE